MVKQFELGSELVLGMEFGRERDRSGVKQMRPMVDLMFLYRTNESWNLGYPVSGSFRSMQSFSLSWSGMNELAFIFQMIERTQV